MMVRSKMFVKVVALNEIPILSNIKLYVHYTTIYHLNLPHIAFFAPVAHFKVLYMHLDAVSRRNNKYFG